MSRSVDRASQGELFAVRQEATTPWVGALRLDSVFFTNGEAWSAMLPPSGPGIDRIQRTQAGYESPRINIVRQSRSDRNVARRQSVRDSRAVAIARTECSVSLRQWAKYSAAHFQSVSRSIAGPPAIALSRGRCPTVSSLTGWKGLAWPQ